MVRKLVVAGNDDGTISYPGGENVAETGRGVPEPSVSLRPKV